MKIRCAAISRGSGSVSESAFYSLYFDPNTDSDPDTRVSIFGTVRHTLWGSRLAGAADINTGCRHNREMDRADAEQTGDSRNRLQFKMDGTKLTGAVSDPQGETAISEGKINGDKISFFVIRIFGGKEMKLVYKGKITLNETNFMREVRGGMGQPQEFIAKREFHRNDGYPPLPTGVPVSPPPHK